LHLKTGHEEFIMRHAKAAATFVALFSILLSSGCALRYTDPSRTATEQYLLSFPTISAVNELQLTLLQGRQVFLETAYCDRIDKEFLTGFLRSKILSAGAGLVDKREEAQIVLEVTSPGVGIDKHEFLLGMPAIAVPLPTGQTFGLPELPLIKRVRQNGVSGVMITAYDRETGGVLYSHGPSIGDAWKIDWTILGLTISHKRNLPEPLL
jgi:hypothetical protein